MYQVPVPYAAFRIGIFPKTILNEIFIFSDSGVKAFCSFHL